MSESVELSKYEIFNDAIGDVNNLNTAIEKAETSIKACQTKLSDESIFMGPIADSCKDESKKVLDNQILNMKKNLNSTKETLSNVSNNYKNSDKNAEKSLGSDNTGSNVSAASSAIAPHSNITSEERQARIDALGGDNSENIIDIQVPYWDGSQEQTMNLTVNKNLEENYQNVFRELADMKFPIKPNNTDAYEYRNTVSGSRLSDHAYGGTVDINYDDNPMVGAGEANPCDDGSNPYVINEEVVEAFAKQGFYWGGDWNSSKDYMHFSWTGW